jgi:hypothetical protein
VSSALPVLLALFSLSGTATRAEAQSTGATVRASVTIVDVVGVSVGSSPLRVQDAGPGEIRIGGSLEVTSQVPHILTSSLGPADLPWVSGQYSHVRSGTEGMIPQRVDVRLDRSTSGRPMKLVYTIAVVL